MGGFGTILDNDSGFDVGFYGLPREPPNQILIKHPVKHTTMPSNLFKNEPSKICGS